MLRSTFIASTERAPTVARYRVTPPVQSPAIESGSKPKRSLALRVLPPSNNVYETTNGECMDAGGPCERVYCRYHLGASALANAHNDGETPTCALDVARLGPQTLNVIGELLGVSRQRAQQIEANALGKLKAFAEVNGIDLRQLLAEFSEGETPTSYLYPESDGWQTATPKDGSAQAAPVFRVSEEYGSRKKPREPESNG
jgi:hypothetical protein